ncbi:MAG: hypothetical protein HQL53_11145 [Magnetococcales bacterium]|nr:hypothetical protein [Magnetococcales bacterium]
MNPQGADEEMNRVGPIDQRSKRRRMHLWLVLAVLFTLPSAPLMAGSLGVGEQNRFGRLFTTPNDRLLLDKARRLAQLKAQRKEQAGQGHKPFQASMTLKGLVTRSNGPTAIWINNARTVRNDPLPDGAHLPQTMRPSESPHLLVQLPRQQDQLILKPGQTLNGLTGEIYETFNVRSQWVDETKRRQTPPSASRMSSYGKEASQLQDMMNERNQFSQKIGELGRVLEPITP